MERYVATGSGNGLLPRVFALSGNRGNSFGYSGRVTVKEKKLTSQRCGCEMHSAARLEIDADVSYLHTTHIQLPCLLLFQTIVVRDRAQDYC